MPTEKFNYIEYSDSKLFINKSGRIELKEYIDDLLFYSSFDSTFNAIYSSSDETAITTGTVSNEINSVFGQSALLDNGSIKYDKANFENLVSEGTIQFRIKPDFLNGKGYQDFKLDSNPIISAIPDLTTEEYKRGGASLYLLGNDQKNIKYDASNVSTMIQEGTIDLSVKFDSIPASDSMLFMIGNEIDNKNKITAYYTNNENIVFKVYDSNGDIIVDISFVYNFNNNWNDFRFNFDINNGSSKVFINGIEHGVEDLSIGSRTSSFDTFIIGATAGYITNYYIDEIAFYSQVVNNSNYTVSILSLLGDEDNLIAFAKYDTSIDLDAGSNTNYISTYPNTNDYNFKVTVDSTLYNITINLESEDTLLDISNKIAVELTNANSLINDNKIRIIADNDGARILIESPDAGRDLLSILNGVDDPILPNHPDNDTILIDLYNEIDNKNRIQLIHTVDSNIKLIMYDEDGIEKINQNLFLWNNDNITWYSFDLNFNDTLGQFFLDGNLKSIFLTNFTRNNIDTYLYISSGATKYYFDELIIYNSVINSKNYIVPDLSLTKYNTSNPYIDIHFGTGFKENEVIDLNLNASLNTSYVVKIENTWYYYLSGAWRESDGSLNQSISPSILETKFSSLYFNESSELLIRVYFNSDGIENSWVDDISIVTIVGEETPAIITGTIDLSNPVDLSSNSHVTITTDVGPLEVDLSSSAVDITAVTLDEIKNAIDAASVPGLAPAMDDGNGHLVLASLDSGSDSFISISSGITTDALNIVWGYESTDSGEEATGEFFDYTEIIRWIRSQLGGGVVPVELTDEQIEDGIAEAVYWYNYYREAKEKVITVSLEGNDTEGYKIPEEVGGEENIIEIIMRPRFPLAYYSGGADSLMSNLYMQWFFNTHTGNGYQNIIGDYYITLSTEKDMETILGTAVSWEFYNNRLFLRPLPTTSIIVGIRFKSSISIAEINTNMLIKAYALGKAKQVLGTIRSTFGGTIPGGSENITLRGESMISEGKEEEEKALDKMMKLSEPLFLEWF